MNYNASYSKAESKARKSTVHKPKVDPQFSPLSTGIHKMTGGGAKSTAKKVGYQCGGY